MYEEHTVTNTSAPGGGTLKVKTEGTDVLTQVMPGGSVTGRIIAIRLPNQQRVSFTVTPSEK